MTDKPEQKRIVAYKLSRPDAGGGWMHAGINPLEIGVTISNEIAANEGLPADECDKIVLEAHETTQAEIDSLPEFGGW